MTWLQTILLAIVEGITEFIPVSSTGHLIVTSAVMGINKQPFTKLFEVCIQFGAILSVVVLYWKKFFDFSRWQFYLKLFVAFIPAIIMGVLFSKKIDALLESTLIVGIMLLVGGIILLFIDNIFKYPSIEKDNEMTYKNAFVIGWFQTLAMIPGVSRSAAALIGGLQQKLTRKLAAEFSFFLAVPTMFAATVKKLYDYHTEGFIWNNHDLIVLLVGNLIAFLVAMIAIRTFITFLQKHSLRVFGFYRIIAGIIIIALFYFKIID